MYSLERTENNFYPRNSIINKWQFSTVNNTKTGIKILKKTQYID